ncbi:MAG TPA: hypothetical protein VL401_04220 [Alphaproteobacteria bacterium]|jgi:hypothetical protein|nr:hypothetical protein [Alphaproteobacteria bacterium]
MKDKITQIFTKIWERIPQRIKDVLVKFYTNKKIFWPVTIAFSLIFFIILLGLLFGNKTRPISEIKNTPSATPAFQLPDSSSKDPNSDPLQDLKKKINDFDVKQSRLTPPTINFDIQF